MGWDKNMAGAIGENIAADFLKKHGYAIEQKNCRTPFGEIDIIARQKAQLVFIEVRTRTSSSLGPPLLTVTLEKQKRIVRNASWYMHRNGIHDTTWRIDVVSVLLNKDLCLKKIEIIENAVQDI
ncbi:MAG: YraN family protein [Candidatus Omnitrophica bacterium]|nr:YraN family protein [Candidatus Omnitrophota bacterium]